MDKLFVSFILKNNRGTINFLASSINDEFGDFRIFSDSLEKNEECVVDLWGLDDDELPVILEYKPDYTTLYITFTNVIRQVISITITEQERLELVQAFNDIDEHFIDIGLLHRYNQNT